VATPRGQGTERQRAAGPRARISRRLSGLPRRPPRPPLRAARPRLLARRNGPVKAGTWPGACLPNFGEIRRRLRMAAARRQVRQRLRVPRLPARRHRASNSPRSGRELVRPRDPARRAAQEEPPRRVRAAARSVQGEGKALRWDGWRHRRNPGAAPAGQPQSKVAPIPDRLANRAPREQVRRRLVRLAVQDHRRKPVYPAPRHRVRPVLLRHRPSAVRAARRHRRVNRGRADQIRRRRTRRRRGRRVPRHYRFKVVRAAP
jgi:hypothetical protein